MSDKIDQTSTKDIPSDKAREEASHSALAEVWQSAKYSLVQDTYDGVAQLGRAMGADIKERQLIDKPQEATTATAKFAQDIGYGVGKAPVVAGMYALTRLGMGRTAASMAIAPTSEASIARLSVAGAMTGGLATSSDGDNLLKERSIAAAAGGLSMYTFGKMQSRMAEAGGLYQTRLPGLVSALEQRAKLGIVGGASGATGGFIGAETQALLSHARPANVEELSRSITAGAALGSTLNVLREPVTHSYNMRGLKSSPESSIAVQPVEPMAKMHVPKFEPARIEPLKPKAPEGK